MANEVEIRVTADTKKAEEKLKGLKGSLSKFSAGAKIGGGALTAFGAIGVATFTKLLSSSKDQEVGINKLDKALQNVGETYGDQKTAIEKVIDATQRKTNFGDEQQREALRTLITIGGDYEGSLDALVVATDLAAGANISLESASLLLARALEGETGALSRVGMKLDEGATKTEILKELTDKFGGSAEAASDPMTQLSNRLGDVGQILGDVLIPFVDSAAVWMEKLATELTKLDPKVIQIGAVVAIAGIALAAIGGPILLLIGFLPLLSGAFGTLTVAMGPITLVILAIAAAVAAVIVVWKNWDNITRAFSDTMQFIKDQFNSKFGWLLPGGALDKAIHSIKDTWEGTWENIKQTFEQVMDSIKAAFESIKKTFDDVMQKITDLYHTKLGWLLPAGPLVKAIFFLKDNWDTIWEGIRSAFETVTDKIMAIATLFKDAFTGIFTGIKNIIVGIWDGIVDGIRGAINWILGAVNSVVKSINNIKIEIPAVRFMGKTLFKGITIDMPQIKELAMVAARRIGDVYSSAAKKAVGVGASAAQAVGGLGLSAAHSLSLAAGGFAQQAGAGASAIGSVVGGKIGAVGSAVGAEGGRFLQQAVHYALSEGDIRSLARGGIATRPTLAMIGEAGPEAIIPLSGGRGIAPVYNIHITGNTVFGEMDFKRLVVDAVTDSHRRGGLPFLGRA